MNKVGYDDGYSIIQSYDTCSYNAMQIYVGANNNVQVTGWSAVMMVEIILYSTYMHLIPSYTLVKYSTLFENDSSEKCLEQTLDILLGLKCCLV